MTAPAPLHDPLDRLLREIEQRGNLTRQRLQELPPTQPCNVCGSEATLDEMSLYDEFGEPRQPDYICPACTAERQRKARAKKLEALGIPRDVWTATLDNFRTDRPNVVAEKFHATPAQFVAACRRFAAHEVRNLILCGSCGIGKGHLAAALVNLALDAGRSVSWVECSKLFKRYHAAYSDRSNDQVTAPLIRASLLVIDEIGLRKLPDDGEEILFEILDARHKAGRQTILLGNLMPKEAREWLGERIRDRLMSGGREYCFGRWDSMRGQEGDGAEF